MNESFDRLIQIGERPVGEGCACLIIAEVGQAHDGSLGAAHAYIDAIARTGADVVKFQTHIAAAESRAEEAFRVAFSPQDATRYDYWKRMEFTEDQWRGLAEHAKESGLIFLSSPFSFEAADMLERVGVLAWKVGAGEATNTPLLRRLTEGGKPILLSTGLVGWREIDTAVEVLRGSDAGFSLLQCTTAYPCPPEKAGLNVLSELASRYGCPVGLSDHSGTIFPGLAAVVLRASVVEVHVTLSRDCFGPDVRASITISELSTLAEGIRFLERALSHRVDKEEMAAELASVRALFGKSVVAARDLPAGHRLRREDLALKKPGTGIPAGEMERLLGRQLSRGVPMDESIREGDLD